MKNSKRWYLHIGMHKTGTSTLQQGMWRTRNLLVAQGIEYGGFEPDHGLSLLSLVWSIERLQHRGRLVRRLGVVDEASIAQLNAETRREIRRLRNSPARSIVLSGEGLSYLNRKEIAALISELRITTDDWVRVIFYARDPIGFASSRAQQHVQSGATQMECVEHLLPGYRQRLEPWLDAFGRSCIDIRIYDPSQLVGGDLCRDFFSALDIPDALLANQEFLDAFKTPYNASLASAAAELLAKFNAELPPARQGRWNAARSKALESHLASFQGSKFALPAPLLERIAEAAQSDVAWLNGVLGRTAFTSPNQPAHRHGQDYAGLALHLLRELNSVLLGNEARVPVQTGTVEPDLGTSWRKRTLSVITPVLPALSEHLPECAASVAATAAALEAYGWVLEWVLVIDGPGEIPEHTRPRDLVTIRLPERSGVAAARNHGLATATGTWLLPLDADDTLVVPGLVALATDPNLNDVVWAAANRRLLDGVAGRHWIDTARTWTMDELEDAWKSPFPFHANTVLVRRSAALRAGGWPALDQDEDIGFIFAVAVRGPGVSLPHDIIRYRKWLRQATASTSFQEKKRRADRFIAAVVNARRRDRGRTPVTPPLDRQTPAISKSRRKSLRGSHVLILGSARSGTSILGELFETLPIYRYLFEPDFADLETAPFHDSLVAAKRPRVPRTAPASPGLPFKLDDMLALPGPPRIAWMVRHPLDAICSLRPGIADGWDHSPRPPNWQELLDRPLIERCAYHWLNINHHGFRQVQDWAHLVHYESLVYDPRGAARGLMRALDVDLTPDVERGICTWTRKVGNKKGASAYEARIQTVWNRHDHSVRVGRFVENLSDSEISVCREILGDVPQEFGYDLSPDALQQSRQTIPVPPDTRNNGYGEEA